MFNINFINTSTGQIISDIRKKGYFFSEQALNAQYVDELLSKIDFNRIMLNTNDVGVVAVQDIKFLTHCLANSQETYNIITSPNILKICKDYFTDSYKLINHRIYQTSKYAHMHWHTDNNRQMGDKLSEKHAMPGLLFMFYLSDVEKNAFQFIEGSHTWSDKYSNEIYLSESYIDKTYSKNIRTFPMKKGSLILCDTHGIHRAEPFHDKTYKRTTLLFQVDEVGSDNKEHGEKNLVNTEYLEHVTPEIMDYLGFGCKRAYPAFPISSLASMNFADIFRLQKQLIPKTLEAITKNLVKATISAETITSIKRMKWQLKSHHRTKSNISRKE